VRDGKSQVQKGLTLALAGPTIEEYDAGTPLWGRYGFDGGKDSRDACRAPLTR